MKQTSCWKCPLHSRWVRVASLWQIKHLKLKDQCFDAQNGVFTHVKFLMQENFWRSIHSFRQNMLCLICFAVLHFIVSFWIQIFLGWVFLGKLLEQKFYVHDLKNSCVGAWFGLKLHVPESLAVLLLQRTLAARELAGQISSVFTSRCSQQRTGHRGEADITNKKPSYFILRLTVF